MNISMNVMIWALPILFMLHDFEEIICIKVWKSRYAKTFETSSMKKLPYADFQSTDSFSIAVLIIFTILIIITILSYTSQNFLLWYGVFFGFAIHFLGHLVLQFRFGHYVPGTSTSIFFLPSSIYLLYLAEDTLHYNVGSLVVASLIGFFIMLLLVFILHKAMNQFSRWLEKYGAPVQ